MPDPPLSHLDIPTGPCAVLRYHEVLAMMNAFHTYQVARADFEKKRASVTLKLLLLAKLESNDDYEVEFNQHGGLIVTEKTSIPMSRYVIGEGDSKPEAVR